MSLVFTQGNTGPPLEMIFTRRGELVDISLTAITVTGQNIETMEERFSREADIVSGKCLFNWQPNDLDFVGEMILQVTIVHPDGRIETVPDGIYLIVQERL